MTQPDTSDSDLSPGYRRNRAWRYRHPAGRNKQRRRNYARSRGGEREREAWTPQEDAAVLEHAVADRILAGELGRSVQAIQIRRARLKKWADR